MKRNKLDCLEFCGTMLLPVLFLSLFSFLQISYKNVAHPRLAAYIKKHNWLVESGEYLTFPQNQTEFKGGVLEYLESIEEVFFPILSLKFEVPLCFYTSLSSNNGQRIGKNCQEPEPELIKYEFCFEQLFLIRWKVLEMILVHKVNELKYAFNTRIHFESLFKCMFMWWMCRIIRWIRQYFRWFVK